MVQAINLTCENTTNPIGTPQHPRFSWQLKSDKNSVLQESRQLQVSADENFSDIIWDSDRVCCSNSIFVPCAKLLSPQRRHYWRVKVWDNHKNESHWSEAANFVTALGEDCFTATFISGENADSGASSAGTMLRGEFTVKSRAKAAFLNSTALGVYRLHLNGSRIGDIAMAPGWTEYNSRLLYQSYDVTSLLCEGVNVVGAMVGPGWYKGDIGFQGKRNNYGQQTAFAMQLTILYEDGSTETISTDENWRASDGPVTYSEIYHGETYDARKEPINWTRSEFDVSGWRDVSTLAANPAIVVPQDGPPVRAREVWKAEKIFTAPNGEVVVDFGQNLTGWVRLRVKGNAGDVVKYSHSEVLDKDGNFYTKNLRSAKQKISYTLKGGTDEVYEPFFTFQGFRYIRIDEFPGNYSAANFEAVAAYSDMPETGSFKCSHPGLNQLEHNVRWGMKSNFLDIPTDCPQRDERLGWTGDAQVFIRAASYLHDISGFFRKWLRDMAESQLPDGAISHVIPDILSHWSFENKPFTPATGWADAAVICPWITYVYTGDIELLRESYPMMTAWVEYIRSQSRMGLVWSDGRHFGDWVALDAKDGSYIGATPTDLIATAYYAYSSELLTKAAVRLGKDDDARKYFKLREEIGDAFVKEFFTPTGRLAARTQTAHVLALHFGLTPSEYRKRTIDTLVEILDEYDNHLSTGFLGTPYICYALSENGNLDLAYELLLKEDYPSWLYPISKGATTIWEHWDGLKPDGTMWSDDMNSFNHYAYGAVADWMYSVIGGIDSDPTEPGYRHSVIAPRPGGGITSAITTQLTPYGKLVSDWTLEGDTMRLNITIPHNTTATIALPKGKISENAGLSFAFDGRGSSAAVGSGTYRFVVENVEVK